MTYVSVGVLRDRDPEQPNDQQLFVEREIFVPARGIEPIQLPLGWMVRAYAPRESIHSSNVSDGRQTGWYDLGDIGPGYQDSMHYELDEANWIFPESDFYDIENPSAGKARHTFMVRFEGGTGRQNVADTDPVLVLAPSPSVQLRQDLGAGPLSLYRVDRASDLGRFVRGVLAAPSPSLGGGGLQSSVPPLRLQDKQAILGDESVDTVLTRPLSQVALYNVKRMAAVIGARGVNNETGSLYLPVEPGDATRTRRLMRASFGPNLCRSSKSRDVSESGSRTGIRKMPTSSIGSPPMHGSSAFDDTTAPWLS